MPNTIEQQIQKFQKYVSQGKPVFILDTMSLSRDNFELIALFRELGERLNFVDYPEPDKEVRIFLSNNKITDEMLAAFFDALSIDKLPRKLYLSFAKACLTTESAILLADRLLKNDSCPPEFSLDVSSNRFDPRGAVALIEAIGLSKCQTLKMDLTNNQLAFGDKIRNTVSLVLGLLNKQSNNFEENNAIIALDEDDRTAYLRKLVEVLTSDNCIENLDINLSSNEISDADCKQLLEGLLFARCRTFNLNLSNNNLTDQSLEVLTNLFTLKHNWPEEFILNISLSKNSRVC
ncbi:MAG: hypothetical protein HKM04_00285 [Legionellales bacterium]|nr:hypothetical protein [Legionellales bacterium]